MSLCLIPTLPVSESPARRVSAGHQNVTGHTAPNTVANFPDSLNDCTSHDHSFPFTVSVSNDTLIQTGIEKIDSLGINRLNIEKYIRVKN